MVSWTIRTARSLSSAGCWCPDPCLGVCCFDADMGYILPKNAASIKPRAVQTDRCGPFRNGDPNSPSAAEYRQLPWFIAGVAVRRAPQTQGVRLRQLCRLTLHALTLKPEVHRWLGRDQSPVFVELFSSNRASKFVCISHTAGRAELVYDGSVSGIRGTGQVVFVPVKHKAELVVTTVRWLPCANGPFHLASDPLNHSSV